MGRQESNTPISLPRPELEEEAGKKKDTGPYVCVAFRDALEILLLYFSTNLILDHVVRSSKSEVVNKMKVILDGLVSEPFFPSLLLTRALL